MKKHNRFHRTNCIANLFEITINIGTDILNKIIYLCGSNKFLYGLGCSVAVYTAAALRSENRFGLNRYLRQPSENQLAHTSPMVCGTNFSNNMK